MLHITNGDSTVFGLLESGLPGEFLAWRDCLHDGPVPIADSLPLLAEVRAKAMADFGWSDYEQLLAEFRARDAKLESFRQHDEVVLWFEHDLYDKLQLLQILSWFHGQDRGGTRLSLIELDSHPEVIPFYGLGQLTGEQLAALFPTRVEVTPKRLAEARRTWQIFASESHEGLAGLDRLLEEYPGTLDGLSRTERQLLRAAPGTRQELYQRASRYEECPWGDSSVYLRLDGLTGGPDPALRTTEGGRYELTETGAAILAGEKDWLAARGGADTWLGGVQLTGFEPKWRWDSQASRLRCQTRPQTR